jgi:hypothetical protein
MRRSILILIVCSVCSGDLRAQTLAPLNLALPTLGGDQFWSDQLVHSKWRVQRNELTGHFRLLDANDVHRGWGTEAECSAAFAALKRGGEIPPLYGKAIITLHGLGRTRNAMNAIGRSIEKDGEYTWINVSYASTRNTLDEHAQSLARVIEGLEGVEEINFVCHSLGNLVVRRYLGEANQEPPRWRVDPRIRRMVMLAPPNNGARLARVTADIVQDNQLVRFIAGPSAWQLAREWDDAKKTLATPSFEFAIIAGGFGEAGLNPLLDGNDDLVVSVDETRLVGASDFRLVPCRHGGVLNDPVVLQHIGTFLKQGYFTTAAEREPVVVAPMLGAAGAGQ